MKTTRFSLAALLAAVALVASSCREPSPLGVGPDQSLIGWVGDATGLLHCSPLPADSVAETIGPEGGTLLVGPHRLWIPPGALAEPVTISAEVPSDTVNQVRFQPEGLTFAQDAYITMSYANCSLVSRFIPKRIAHATDLLEILEYLLSFDAWWAQRVTGRLEHFSTYAIAW